MVVEEDLLLDMLCDQDHRVLQEVVILSWLALWAMTKTQITESFVPALKSN